MSREKKKESLLSITHIVKVPKIRPAAYIFQRPFLRGLFLEALIFGGAYLWREISVSKSIGLAYSWKEIDRFCFILVCIWGQFPSTSPRGGLYSKGWFNGGFLALRVWGAYIYRGLYVEGPIFGILRYCVQCLNITTSQNSITYRKQE